MPVSRSLLILCFLAGGMLAAKANDYPKQEFTRTINREFGTTADGTTALYNKYGTVNVKTWQNNSVKIDITIIVNAGSQRDADKVFDRIKVNFANAAGYVKAETMIESQSGINWGNDCKDFKINYEVSMPASNQLDLKNKYGNSYVAPLNGKLFAEIKYGDLRTEAINNDADLILGYGKGYITRVNNIYGQVSYSQLTITEAREIQLDTKYSELKSDRASALRLTSKYDDFDLGEIGELRLQTKYANLRVRSVRTAYLTAQYTDVRFSNLTETADADLSYGSLKIENISRNFSNINTTSKYTDVQLFTEKGASYRFELEGNYVDIKTPPGASMRSQYESGSHEKYEGHVGDASAKGLIKVSLKYGGLTLR
jgi:flagellar basal body rod protein FlgC